MKYFVFISIFSILLGIITKSILNLDILMLDSLSSSLTNNQINEYLNFQKRWQWLSYSIIPLLLLIKTTLISSVLYVGTFFYSKAGLTFKQLLNLVVKAEFVFLGVGFFKIIWFYFFQVNYTLDDIQYFYPFSAINITGYKGLEPWLIYPLQTLNLFELAYIIFLAYQLGTLTKTNADTGLKIVAYSYVPTLFLWVTVVMFFTLNYS